MPIARRFLLACAVALLGSGSARAEIKERVAAVVNGQPIALSDVAERAQLELQRADALPEGPQRDKEREAVLRRTAEQLVDEALIEAEANQLGIEVGEDDVQKQVEALAKQNGMDVPQFREALGAQGLAFENVRDSLRKQALQFRLLQYKVKPRKVSDEEIQAAYAALNANPDIEVRARHLFVATPAGTGPAQLARAQARAEEALRRIRAGEEFAVVARALSDGPSAKEGGDLGYFRKGTLFPEADQAAFTLRTGETSRLLHTSSGYHLFRVEDRRSLPPRPLAEVREELRARIINDSLIKERENYLRSLRKSAQIEVKL